jgi:hypothetical protein
MTLPPCDSCGRTVTSDHVALRFRRLEMATQYRPIHIGVLFLTDAPPPALEDYFYSADASGARRSPASRAFFDSLMTAVGISPGEGNLGEGKNESALLTEFQRRGCYLAEAVECPFEPHELSAGVQSAGMALEGFARRHWPTLLKRIQYSYKPRNIVLFSKRTRSFIPMFKEAGLGDRLLLHRGGSLELPIPGDSKSTVSFIVQLGSLVALSQSALRA